MANSVTPRSAGRRAYIPRPRYTLFLPSRISLQYRTSNRNTLCRRRLQQQQQQQQQQWQHWQQQQQQQRFDDAVFSSNYIEPPDVRRNGLTTTTVCSSRHPSSYFLFYFIFSSFSYTPAPAPTTSSRGSPVVIRSHRETVRAGKRTAGRPNPSSPRWRRISFSTKSTGGRPVVV